MNRNSNMRIALRLITILVFAAGLVGCNGCGSNPVEPKDTTRPTVVSTSPIDGDTWVALEASILVNFTESMDQSSLIEGVLTLDPAVAGTTSATANSVTFVPTNGLDTNVSYTATVSTSAQDLAGNNLASDYVWQFVSYLDTVPPTIVETTPVDSSTSVSVNTDLRVIFSEVMDQTSLTASSFQIVPSVSGVFSNTYNSMTFNPDVPLDMLQWYTVTLTTGIADIKGNHLAEPYIWNFYTYPDTTSPTAALMAPVDSDVIGDASTVEVNATDNDQVSHVEFYVDNILVPNSADSTAPYEFIWNGSGFEVASEHTVSAVAYDETGNSVSTDTATVFYLWRQLGEEDRNEPLMPRNLRNIWYRTTNQQIQFRVETYSNWTEYNDDTLGINVAFYFDTDQDSTTGDKFTGVNNDLRIGDIGADYRMIIGFFGRKFEPWTGSGWGTMQGFEDFIMASDTNMFEVSIALDSLDNPFYIDMVVANVHIDVEAESYRWDWAPNKYPAPPPYHVTAVVDQSYVPAVVAKRQIPPGVAAATVRREGPFD